MNLALWTKTIREGAWLLAGCAALVAVLQWIRVWATGQIDMESARKILNYVPDFARDLLPMDISVLVSPQGRIALGFEEPLVVTVICIWGVARGSDSVSGEINRGTMEMLLAQPVRRWSVHAVHSITTLVGMVVLAAAALLGVAIGVATVELETPVRTAYFLPGALNLLCLGALVVALTTMLSAFDSQRGRTIGLAVGFVVVETIVKIVGRVGDEMDWLRYWTVLTAFEPQIAVNTFGTPDSPMLIYNGFLLGLSALFFIVGAIGFNYRDVPAPL